MTLKVPYTTGKPPDYPTSSMVPPEFWRHQPDGDVDNLQIQTVETAPGVFTKNTVVPGWNNPVNFTSDTGDND